jgi:hypothetical protein
MFNFLFSFERNRDFFSPSLSLSFKMYGKAVKVLFSIARITESRGTGSLFSCFIFF